MRDYGTVHRAARDRWRHRVAQGSVLCARCGERIKSGEYWDLDHRDDGHGYLGPSHSRCNRAAGAVKTNRERAEALRAIRGRPARETGTTVTKPKRWPPEYESWWDAHKWSRHWGGDGRYPWCPCDNCHGITTAEYEALRLEVLARRA